MIVVPDFNRLGGESLARYLDEELLLVHTRKFPNGEVLARLDDPSKIKNKSVTLYFPTYPETNDRILLLLETLESLKHYNAEAAALILPYLSYSRQDKRFLEGESLSLKLFLDLLHLLNVKRLIAVDVHNEKAVREYTGISISIVSLYEELVKKILAEIVKNDDFILVAPDAGRSSTVSMLAERFSSKYVYFEKKRDRYTGDIEMKPVGELSASKYAVIIDDEISSGGTMAKAAGYLKNAGVKIVVAAAIHLLLVNNAEERLSSSGVDYIVGTNTIQNPFTLISIEDYLSKII